MTRIYENGRYREATAEEEAEWREQLKKLKEYDRLHPVAPTPEERLTKLEEENAELRQALEILLGDGKAAQK